MSSKSTKRISRKKFHVVIFGSARIKREDPNWILIYDLARRVSEKGMDVVTGGGPGLMDAASEGHYIGDIENKSKSIGLQIKLPHPQKDARYLEIKREFSRFSRRLDDFMELANVVVVAPGGVGTVLELFYTWQLIQVKMKQDIPIILLGDMWLDFMEWIRKWMLKEKLIEKKDVDLLFLAKDNEEVMCIINKAYKKFMKKQN